MDIKSEPQYVDVPLRQLEVGVYGDIRQVTVFERDTLTIDFSGDIYVKLLKADDLTVVLEETIFKNQHIQWFTILYRTIRQLAEPAPPPQSDTPGEPPASSPTHSTSGESS